MESVNMSATVEPKSDQLNADDLISGSITIKITVVKHCGGDQPIAIHFEGDNGKPYKPCKSMRRVLIHAWGNEGSDYVGKSACLYLDPEVKFGGIKVGGIRISHLSHLDRVLDIALTATKGKRTPYQVKPLKTTPPPAAETRPDTQYPDADFEKNLPAWVKAISAGKVTAEDVAQRCKARGTLSDAQFARLRSEDSTTEQEVY